MGAVNRDRVLGSLAGYPDGFAEDLARQGCSSSVARSHGQLMQHLSWWMACSGLAVSDSDMVGVDEYLRWRRETGYVRGLTREQIEPVIGYLRRVGAAPPLPDPASGMPLLTRRVQILGQPPAHRALIHPQHRSGPLRNLPHRRDRISQRRTHRASVHPVPLRQLPDRAPLIPVLTSDTFELLHPRSLLQRPTPSCSPWLTKRNVEAGTSRVGPNQAITTAPSGATSGWHTQTYTLICDEPVMVGARRGRTARWPRRSGRGSTRPR